MVYGLRLMGGFLLVFFLIYTHERMGSGKLLQYIGNYRGIFDRPCRAQCSALGNANAWMRCIGSLLESPVET